MIRSLVFRTLGRPAGFLVGHMLRLSRRPLAIALMYHQVAERQGDPRRELVPPHSTRLFERQLRHVRQAYRPVPASHLLDEAAKRRRGERIPVAVTFDDDHSCHRALSMPILIRLGVPATFFLSGGSPNGSVSPWWERLQRASDRGASLAGVIEPHDSIHEAAARVESMAPAEREATAERLLEVAGPDSDWTGMSPADVSALAQAGFEIGFHTLRHHRLTGLDDDDLARAMVEGRGELAKLAGGVTDVIAYPHGKADERVASAARAAGFRVGFTSLPGAVDSRQDDPLLLRRVEPSFRSAGHLAAQLALALLRARRRGGER